MEASVLETRMDKEYLTLREFAELAHLAEELGYKIKVCPHCRGNGQDPKFREFDCFSCNGRKVLRLDEK